MIKLLLLVASAVLVVTGSDGYRILCVFTIPTKSHNILGKGIVRALLQAGHQVTWATPYPEDAEPAKNLTVIDISATRPLHQDMEMNDKRLHDFATVIDDCKKFTAITFENPELRKAIVDGNFDAVVSEWFFTDSHSGIAATLQVPWILFSSVNMHPYLEHLMDELRSPPILPAISASPVPMAFFHRLANSAIFLLIECGPWWFGKKTADFYESIFKPLASARGVTLPPFDVAVRNVSILLVNSHPTYYHAQSLPPNVIEIGGFHIDEVAPPLPKDIQTILDSSTKGVIYFSLGSVVSSKALPERTKKDIIQILGALPYTVLWKFEEQLENLPGNIHVMPWMPQASILSHPNTKLFMTHGGLLSTIEAIHFGVPLLVIPVFGDQLRNAVRAVQDGYAVHVPYAEDMGQDLKLAVERILGNDSYRQRVTHLSKLFHSRPVPPSKLISHYVELAIESKGAYHLRSKARLYPWYQRWLLDQLAFVIATLYLLYRIVKKLVGIAVNFLVKWKSETKEFQQKAKTN